MRELTEEELKLAPEWATHYTIDGYDDAVYQSENLCWWVNLESPLSHNNMDKGAVEIIKKTFDITKHEWSDEAKDCHILFNTPSWAGGDLQICIADPNGNYADDVLIREHAIAIAKHFGLTAEDLR